MVVLITLRTVSDLGTHGSMMIVTGAVSRPVRSLCDRILNHAEADSGSLPDAKGKKKKSSMFGSLFSKKSSKKDDTTDSPGASGALPGAI